MVCGRVEDGDVDDGAKVPSQDALLKPEAKITSGNGTSRSHAPRRRKLIRLALALLVAAIAVTAWLLWDRTPAGPALILTLPTGGKYQFAGVTYGTTNMPPSLELKVFNLLPKRLANLAYRYVGRKITWVNEGGKIETPQLFVWFRPVGTNAPLGSTSSTFLARLADQAGNEAGVPAYLFLGGGASWTYASFQVFPRRSRLLECTLYRDGGPGKPGPAIAHVTFPNPLYGHFPAWKPEAVPSVKMAGDLQVRLDSFTTGRRVGPGAGGWVDGSRGLPIPPAVRGQDTETLFEVYASSLKGTNEIWEQFKAELCDATGNALRGGGLSAIWNGDLLPLQLPRMALRESIPGMLWPDEAAWRLKLEFKREFGLAPEEIVTFKDVPVPAVGTTNFPGLTETAGGIQIKLTKFVRQPNLTVRGGPYYGASQVVFELPGKPDGVATDQGLGSGAMGLELPGKPERVAIDFLGMKTDAGQAEGYDSIFQDFAYVFYVKSIPTNAKTMDLTFVVQKIRTVEFLVPPPKPQ